MSDGRSDSDQSKIKGRTGTDLHASRKISTTASLNTKDHLLYSSNIRQSQPLSRQGEEERFTISPASNNAFSNLCRAIGATGFPVLNTFLGPEPRLCKNTPRFRSTRSSKSVNESWSTYGSVTFFCLGNGRVQVRGRAIVGRDACDCGWQRECAGGW